ncbi:MAG: hypothetical protein ACR2G3_07465, partial [Solirubrobacterales bacterium]
MTSHSPQNSPNPVDDEGGAPLLDLARTVDEAAGGRVVVFGSPPPEGRDLDLLVRAAQERSIASRLAADGLRRRGIQWAAFRDCGAVGVDLVPTSSWRLPEAELASLFDEAEVLPGFRRLAAPAPHHAVLIAARRVARAGVYEDRLRERIEAILAGAPSAWEEAALRAPAWEAEAALDSLRRLDAGEAAPG